MYKPSCVFCGGRKIVKFGLPRWRCLKCKRTFRVRRADRRDKAALDGYLKDRSTFERLGERWGVAKSTAYERVKRALEKQQDLLSRTKHSLNRCDGVCLLDAKHRRILGKKYAIFVAWDRGLGQPIHALIQEGGEKELWYWRLLVDLKRSGYVPKAFVSDGFIALKEFIADAYPGLPHQRCTAHVFMFAKSKVATGRNITEEDANFLERIKTILWSPTLRIAKKRLHRLQLSERLRPKDWRALEIVGNALEECFVCKDSKWKHLLLPRTSNAIENVMGHLEARFKTTRGSKRLESVRRLVNRLLMQIKPQSINH
jgi:hypothetical protein